MHDADNIEQAFVAMCDPSLQPIYVHCALGRDRTGLLVALYRVRQLGWSPAAAYQEMQSQRFNRLLIGIDHYFWNFAVSPPVVCD
jgi:protein tyrosine/serine phosphatase